VKKILGIVLVLSLVLSFSLVATTPVAAATLNVPSASYPTIQAAIDAAPAGATIIVAAGTYVEQLTITTSGLTIRPANSSDEVIVRLPDSGLGKAEIVGRMRTWVIWVHGVENVTLQGLTVCGGDGAPEKIGGEVVHLLGIVYDDASGTVWGNTVQNIRRSEPGTAGNYFSYSKAITVKDASGDFAIRDNTVLLHEHGRTGIYVYGAVEDATVTIEGNEVFGVGDAMVHDWMHSGIVVQDVAATVNVIDNDLEDIRSDKKNSTAIYILGVAGISGEVTIAENRITGADYGMLVWGPSGAARVSAIKDNTIEGSRIGIELHEGGEVDLIHGNTLDGNVWGIRVYPWGGHAGINEIKCNTIENSTTGAIGFFEVSGTISLPVVRYNNIVGNDWGLLNNYGEDVDAILNWWGHASGPFYDLGNQGGKGDEVSENVGFMPWLMEEDGEDLTETNTGYDVNAFASTTRVSATATGGNVGTTVTVGEYVGNPTGVSPGFRSGALFIDVHVGGPAPLPTQLVVEVACPGGSCSGVELKWWDGGQWLPVVSPTSVVSGKIQVVLSATSSPTIAQLTGTPFGLGSLSTVGWEGAPVNKAGVMAPWIALLATMMAGAALLVRRRRAQI